MIWSFLFYLVNFVCLSTIYPFQFVLIKKKTTWDYWSSQKKQATLILSFKYHCYTAFLSKRCVDSWQGCLSASSWCEWDAQELPLGEVVLFTLSLSYSHKCLGPHGGLGSYPSCFGENRTSSFFCFSNFFTNPKEIIRKYRNRKK